MFSDQILLFFISLAVALGAATEARLHSRLRPSRRYWLKALMGSGGVAAGVFVTLFVLSGYGWGWPDLSPSGTRAILVKGGVAAGALFAGFAWLVSGKISALAVLFFVVNVGAAVMPYEYNLIRLSVFSLGNYFVLSAWLALAERRRVSQ